MRRRLKINRQNKKNQPTADKTEESAQNVHCPSILGKDVHGVKVKATFTPAFSVIELIFCIC